MIAAPLAGATVAGTVTVSATADSTATRIELYVDGTLLLKGKASSLSAPWKTLNAANGNHQLTAKAWNAANVEGDSQVTEVTVDNSGTAPPPATCAAGMVLSAGSCVPASGGCNSSGADSAWVAFGALLLFFRRRQSLRE